MIKDNRGSERSGEVKSFDANDSGQWWWVDVGCSDIPPSKNLQYSIRRRAREKLMSEQCEWMDAFSCLFNSFSEPTL